MVYCKSILRYILLVKILKKDVHSDKILGLKVKFLDYRSFLQLFKEVFIKRTYYFHSDNDSPSIIDCGSNIGITVLFFKKFYPDAKITAFEPKKEIFEVLKENVQNNKLKYVKLVNMALFDVEGKINLHYDPKLPFRSSLIDKIVGLEFCEKVDTTCLSSYIKCEVDFLKMDIEGAEVAVIKELIKNNKLKLIKNMAVECHHITPKESTFQEFMTILENNNYSTTRTGDMVSGKQKQTTDALNGCRKP